MLTVPVEIRKSEIHGYGVFAKTDIRHGTVIWEFTPGLDRVISLFAIQHAQPRVRDYVMERGFINPQEAEDVVICTDEAQFMNFPKPGVLANTELGGVIDGQNLLLASEDIMAGTEITVPPESDLDYARKMRQQHETPG
jgi:hypothetical protein